MNPAAEPAPNEPDARHDVEVFRRVYAAIGFATLAALTRLPGLSHLLDLGDRWFARNRLRLTGRCDAASCALPRREAAARS